MRTILQLTFYNFKATHFSEVMKPNSFGYSVIYSTRGNDPNVNGIISNW